MPCLVPNILTNTMLYPVSLTHSRLVSREYSTSEGDSFKTSQRHNHFPGFTGDNASQTTLASAVWQDAGRTMYYYIYTAVVLCCPIEIEPFLCVLAWLLHLQDLSVWAQQWTKKKKNTVLKYIYRKKHYKHAICFSQILHLQNVHHQYCC